MGKPDQRGAGCGRRYWAAGSAKLDAADIVEYGSVSHVLGRRVTEVVDQGLDGRPRLGVWHGIACMERISGGGGNGVTILTLCARAAARSRAMYATLWQARSSQCCPA